MNHSDTARSYEQRATGHALAGDYEQASWWWHLAALAWRDAVKVESNVVLRGEHVRARELAYRNVAETAERMADELGREPAPTQPGGEA